MKTLNPNRRFLSAMNANSNAPNATEKAAPMALITLPYAADVLEPVISQKTIDFHYGKHLRGYVNNLNAAIVGTEYEQMPLEEIVQKAQGGIFNNAGQILNHNLYFTQFLPGGGGEPSGKLADAIQRAWGPFSAFQEVFTQRGATLFGSGWVWLSADQTGQLFIETEANAGNPIVKGLTPLLTFDVWEHAYYLDYQNRRADHLKQLWSIINWKVVEERYEGRM